MNKSQPKSNISWPDVVFLAEAEKEAFADVQIITLYSHCLNQAEEQDLPLDKIQASEYVEVFEDRVVIAVDADTVDDEAVAKALDLLTHVDNFQVGTHCEFPPKRSYNYQKLH